MTSISRPKVTVFCLHYLGGSTREWSGVATASDDSIRLLPIDLPGFGEAALRAGFSVESMASFVADAIRLERPERWMLAGHSMGAKVAAVLARWQADGKLDVDGLVGLVLLAGSPPSPEPMSDDKRSTMSCWFGGKEEESVAEAKGYVADNVGAPLELSSAEVAVTDVLTCKRAAWVAWLQEGSKEDWAARIGLLNIPTLIVTGSADQGLGREAQRRHMAPHFADLKMVDLPGAGHLLPLERPQVIAQLIAAHATRSLATSVKAGGAMQSYEDLIMSDRVGEGTRAALLTRINWQPSGDSKALSSAQRDILEHMLDRIIPQHGAKIDFAVRLDEQLASGQGDGWRFAVLPADHRAYQDGLDCLEAAALKSFGQGFIDLDGSKQDDLLARIASGAWCAQLSSTGASLLDTAQMKKWFDDVRADAARLYMSHPDTLARVGYSGVANGGDGQPKSGFIRIGLGEIEAWEPNSEKQPS